MSEFTDTFNQVVSTYEIRPELHFYPGQSVTFSGFLVSAKNKEKHILQILVIYSSPQLHKIELRINRASLGLANDLTTLADLRETFDPSDSAERIVSMFNTYTTRQ